MTSVSMQETEEYRKKSLPLEGKGTFAPPAAEKANGPLMQRSKKPSRRMREGFFGHRKLGEWLAEGKTDEVIGALTFRFPAAAKKCCLFRRRSSRDGLLLSCRKESRQRFA